MRIINHQQTYISNDIETSPIILIYPNKYIAQRRLTTIHNLKQLKRTERLVVNQPYIYYHEKKDLKNYPFSELLYHIKCDGFEIENYQFENNCLTATIHKVDVSYKINATLNNIPQIYKRLSLNQK